ncbi:MAG: ATP-binding protein [Candidatus Micrarchaeia archaeon]
MAFAYRIVALPDRLDRKLFIESMLGRPFVLYYALGSGEAYVIVQAEKDKRLLESAVYGLKLELAGQEIKADSATCMSAYALGSDPVSSACDVLSGVSAHLLVLFAPVAQRQVERAKKRIEHDISSKEIRLTRGYGSRTESQSTQTELYYDSDRRKLLLSMLESLNAATLASGTAYATSLAVFGADAQVACTYLRARLLVLAERTVNAASADELFEKLQCAEPVPLDTLSASKFISFPSSIKRVHVLGAQPVASCGNIVLGNVLERGVSVAGPLAVDASTLNLGTIITGVPGTGKTYEAMGIADQALGIGVPVVVIAPTNEWNGFGNAHSLPVISLYRSQLPINFFKCDSDINIERFYENLAMLLAIASNAGPYTRSLEKVLLASFKKIYGETRDPDPSLVYDEIENEIIDEHAKRNNVGVEYTKHGENVRAALQNLRLLLSRPEFAYSGGVNMSMLLKRGAVFDLSHVSNSMKPFFYALLLSQVYSLADSFDVRGDSELRLLICLEEAQLALQSGEPTAASIDLGQRIQDFRKKGVGLMLVAHNVTDIDQGVRRLCQTKLYFRQSADVSKYAANDLMFVGENPDDVASMLKLLGHRICAANYVASTAAGKEAASSVVLLAREFNIGASADNAESQRMSTADSLADMVIAILGENGLPSEVRIELEYAGEKIFRGETGKDGTVVVRGTLKGKRYKLIVLGEKKRDTRTFYVLGGESNKITLAQNSTV